MAMNFNKCVFSGSLAEDVIYHPDNGKVNARALGRLIVNRPPGSDKNRYDVIPFIAWGNLAKVLKEHTHKGKELGFEGKLQTNSVRGDDGNYKNFFQIKITELQLGRDSGETLIKKAMEAGEGSDSPEVRKAVDFIKGRLPEKTESLPEETSLKETRPKWPKPPPQVVKNPFK